MKKLRFAFLAALLLLPPCVHAQVRSSTIVGTVTDSTGAAVPAADVLLREQNTNIS
jgi:hypothetical protein